MKTPKISVIVPVYNVEQYLPRCIDSILTQTFTDFELLLIDDGSKDSTGKICEEYAEKDKRIRVFHKENGGVSSARNLGLDNAKGDFILFCDSDDKTLPQWISQFVPYLEEFDLITAGYFNKYSNGIMNKICVGELDDKEIIILLLDNTCMLGYLWCKCFKRNIIVKNNIRFNENLKLMEDLDFTYKYLIYSNRIKTIVGYNYIYNVPDFEIKYKQTTALDSIYGICNSLNCLDLNKPFYNHILYKYLLCAENEIMKAYKYQKNNYEKVTLFLSIINDFGHYYTDRIIFRIIYRLFSKPKYSFIVHLILKSKSFLAHIYKKINSF